MGEHVQVRKHGAVLHHLVAGDVVVGEYLEADMTLVSALCSLFDGSEEEQMGWLCPSFDEQ